MAPIDLGNGFLALLEEIAMPERDGETWLIKIKGPNSCFTYEFQISGTILGTSPDYGGFNGQTDSKIEDMIRKTKSLIQEGQLRDLIIPRHSMGYGKVAFPSYPLRKYNCAQYCPVV